MTIRILRSADGALVAERCQLADSPWRRLLGLLGRAALPAGTGLLVEPSSSIHMLGMRFAIDAVFLDRDLRVLRVVADLRPGRLASCRRARSVLELPAGTIARLGLERGDVLSVEPA